MAGLAGRLLTKRVYVGESFATLKKVDSSSGRLGAPNTALRSPARPEPSYVCCPTLTLRPIAFSNESSCERVSAQMLSEGAQGIRSNEAVQVTDGHRVDNNTEDCVCTAKD